MTTTTRTLDTGELEQRVQRMYEEVALEPQQEFHFETGRALAERLGYPAHDLDRIPAAAIESFAGVGYFLDLAAIVPGESVLDLGSGSGTDSFLAALAAGPEGRVAGVDMTDAQLTKARHLAAENCFADVEFHAGYIERPPVEAGVFDCVISNGVINLSPDKPAVFAAAARALRPGGRLALADIVTAEQLPEGVTCDAALWAACIGGAMQRDRYRAAIEAAGFQIESWRENSEYRFVSEQAANATRKYGVTSISLLARRREPTPTEDKKMLAIDCPCGHRLEAADAEALFQAAREHITRDHPEMQRTDEQIRERVAADAYEVVSA
jgi:ubiquinone/menaquinone biosynthesis C-methylase UbiE